MLVLLDEGYLQREVTRGVGCSQKTGVALNENCVQASVEHGGDGIMVWGCMSRKGMEILEKVNRRLDENGYIYILESALVPTRDMLSMQRRCIFQQDNATCHTSKLVKQWFKEKNITIGQRSLLISTLLRTCGIILRGPFKIRTRKTLRHYGNQSRMPGTKFHVKDLLIYLIA